MLHINHREAVLSAAETNRSSKVAFLFASDIFTALLKFLLVLCLWAKANTREQRQSLQSINMSVTKCISKRLGLWTGGINVCCTKAYKIWYCTSSAPHNECILYTLPSSPNAAHEDTFHNTAAFTPDLFSYSRIFICRGLSLKWYTCIIANSAHCPWIWPRVRSDL